MTCDSHDIYVDVGDCISKLESFSQLTKVRQTVASIVTIIESTLVQ